MRLSFYPTHTRIHSYPMGVRAKQTNEPVQKLFPPHQYRTLCDRNAPERTIFGFVRRGNLTSPSTCYKHACEYVSTLPLVMCTMRVNQNPLFDGEQLCMGWNVCTVSVYGARRKHNIAIANSIARRCCDGFYLVLLCS